MSHHEHQVHETHDHVHGPECEHTAVRHDDHVDYLHDGHLHHPHDDHVDEHVITVDADHPDGHTTAAGGHGAEHEHGPSCGHETVPHDDHLDFLVMVLARVVGRLEAGDAVSRIHALDEGELVEELERAVDGRAAHRLSLVGQRALELLGAAQAPRCSELLEHELAAAAAAQSGGPQRRMGAFEPVLAHTAE